MGVYCKYHYLEGHESENNEVEIFKFLVNISRNKIDITKTQYKEDNTQSLPFSIETHCGTTPLGKDDYYCNEDLVKQLVFDAKLSAPYFRSWSATEEERNLARKYNVSVRFIATSSGLTRWHYIFDDSKNEWVDEMGNRSKDFNGKVFGDYYYNAIEETWYKAAVLQHMIDKESIVIATPLPVLDKTIKNNPDITNEDNDITVTASYAIFYKDGNSETPAAVVGFQYMYSNFYEIFANITKNSRDLTCDEHGSYDCYLIDSSGYIVVNIDRDKVGKFFGYFYKGVLKSFIEKKIFDHVEVFNYQALCPVSIIPKQNNAFTLNTPFEIVWTFIKWILTETLFISCNFFQCNKQYSYAEDSSIDEIEVSDDYSYGEGETTTNVPDTNDTVGHQEEETELFSCDHRITLYILNQSYFLNSMGVSPVVSEEKAGKCHSPYWATLVTKTNLLLVVVDKNYYDRETLCDDLPNTTEPVPTTDSTTSREPCHKLDLGRLTRRRLEGCFTYHDKENNITACGRGSLPKINALSFVAATALATLFGSLIS